MNKMLLSYFKCGKKQSYSFDPVENNSCDECACFEMVIIGQEG